MKPGVIFDIQRFALHDGPGIRTTVFMKGCSNSCGWCHNPESFSTDIQLQFYPKRCIFCMKCVEACPKKAHTILDEGEPEDRHTLDRAKCVRCGACAAECYADAVALTGRRVTEDEVIREVMEDAPYYGTSGGGVTFSGGEPVLQHEFLYGVLKSLKEKRIHTALQTAGNYPFGRVSALLPYLDIIMYDVKAISEDIYAKHIRGDRSLILDNLLKLDNAFEGAIIVRTPVIGGVNATREEIGSIASFIKPLKHLESYRLIPYHGLGRVKYDALGKEYGDEYATPPAETIATLEAAAAAIVPVYNHVKGYVNGDKQ